jgi:hypothetical protein
MVKLYPDNVYENPPTEFEDSIVELAEKINKAVEGWGTDENALIRELGDEPAENRVNLYYCYKEKYENDLQAVMKSELGSRSLGMAMQLLSLPLDMAEATIVKNAMSGLGTTEHLLYPVICGRENDEIVKLKATYFSMFSEDMSVKLAGELGGDFERMIFWCLQGLEKEYDADYFTDEKAEADAEAFHEAGEGSFGTDESSLFKIIGESPAEHLENVNSIHVDKYEITLIGALNNEVGGDAGRAARYAVGMKLKPYKTAAQHIAKSCEGWGTDEIALTCAILRYQSIMGKVEEAHIEEYGQTISERIESEVGGKYKRLLQKMVEYSL